MESTAQELSNDPEALAQTGAWLLTKPFTRTKLAQTVAAILREPNAPPVRERSGFTPL